MSDLIRVGIVGATGYTGMELLRLLAHHPCANVCAVTARSEAGVAVSDYFPSLRGLYDHLTFKAPQDCDLSAMDVVFFATPHTVAMQQAPDLLEKGVRVIDLSADFRLRDVATWEAYYAVAHLAPAWAQKAVYGLSEHAKNRIRAASLVANPGCYPTCVSLPLIPLLQEGYLQEGAPIIADCKSGISGAGRKAAVNLLLSEAAENFKAYGVLGHRHVPEICQIINDLSPNLGAEFVFVPHLLPMIRGMHATLYLRLKSGVDPQVLLENYYAGSLFVDVMPSGSTPETRSVKGSNTCRISIQKLPNTDAWVVLSVIDNLVKGAAGQAVQNMNIMFDWPEETGLQVVPLLP